MATNKTLRDLFELDDLMEPEAAPPPVPQSQNSSSAAGYVEDKQAPTEKQHLFPEKESKPEKSPATSLKDVLADNEAATAESLLNIQHSLTWACQAEPSALENSIEKQVPRLSSVYIGQESPIIAENSPDSHKIEGSKSNGHVKSSTPSDTETFKTAIKSLVTSLHESLKSSSSSDESSQQFSTPLEQENLKSVEKCPESSEEVEASKPELVTEPAKPKRTVTVRVQSNQNVCDSVNVGKPSVLKPCPSVGTNLEAFDHSISPLGTKLNGCGHQASSENGSMVEEAWERLNKSYVIFKGIPVGTLAAMDPSADALNYNQIFVRDFVPSGLACLMKDPNEPEIVKNFLLKTLHLQGSEKRIDNFTLGEGVMPASFKVIYDFHRHKEVLAADFGAAAIGRVAPVDSGFWWIILLRSYTKCTRDYALAELPEVQRGMKLILNLCLSDGFDTFPTLLCADGCCMIDRRMGMYGYPIEIQALFYFALRCAQQILKPERDGNEFIEKIEKRIAALSYHIQTYYWLDFTQLNNIYRYKTEEYSHTAVNKFNVIPESIPDWVFDFMPLRGGYLIGNVSPARMDFRWFLVGNCIAILSSLVTPAQATAIMDLIEARWEDLIGEMPLKIAYPALEGHEWRIVTGYDPKNTRWSYHNGGSWPVLLWLLAAACIKTGRPQIAKRAIELVEQRLAKDGWPEYYDGKTGRYVGKQARKYQTWSIAGYLVAKMMVENPSNLLMISLEEDRKIRKPRLTRSTSL